MSDPDGPLPGFGPPSKEPAPYPSQLPSYEQTSYPVYEQTPYPGYPGMPGVASPPAPGRRRRPGVVDFAFWLILLGGAISVAMLVSALLIGNADLERSLGETLAEDGPYTEEDLRSFKAFVIAMFAVLLAVPLALFVVFGFVMRGGRNWARVTLTVLLSIGLLVALGIAVAPAYVPVRLLAVLMIPLNVAIIVAMFQSAANQYFVPRARMGGWTT